MAGPPQAILSPLNPQHTAQSLLERAILAFERRRSTSAKIRQRVDLLGKRLVGSGLYLEQRTVDGLQLRLELTTQMGDEAANLLQVCDGQYLWTYYRGARDSGTLSRVAVVRVLGALEEMGELPGSGKIGSWLGMGGIPRLLRGLNDGFQFVAAVEGHLDHTPVWKLYGQWRPEKLIKLLPDQGTAINEGTPIDSAKLPPHLPDHVVLCVGKEDLFPYQVEYHRLHPNPKSRYPAPKDGVLVAVELFDVVANVPIPAMRFHYNPGDLEFTDQTEAYLQTLRAKR